MSISRGLAVSFATNSRDADQLKPNLGMKDSKMGQRAGGEFGGALRNGSHATVPVQTLPATANWTEQLIVA